MRLFEFYLETSITKDFLPISDDIEDKFGGQFKTLKKIGKIDSYDICTANNWDVFLLFDDKKLIGGAEYRELNSGSIRMKNTGINNFYSGQNLGFKLYKFLIVELNLELHSDKIISIGGLKIWKKLSNDVDLDVYEQDMNNGSLNLITDIAIVQNSKVTFVARKKHEII